MNIRDNKLIATGKLWKYWREIQANIKIWCTKSIPWHDVDLYKWNIEIFESGITYIFIIAGCRDINFIKSCFCFFFVFIIIIFYFIVDNKILFRHGNLYEFSLGIVS